MAKSLTNIVADLDRLKTSAVTTLTSLTKLKAILSTGITNPFAPMVKSANALTKSIRQISIEMVPLQTSIAKNPLAIPMMVSLIAVAPALLAASALTVATTPAAQVSAASLGASKPPMPAPQEINITAIIEADGKAVATAVFDTIKTHNKTREEVESIAVNATSSRLA